MKKDYTIAVAGTGYAILKVSNKNQYDRFSKFSKELAIAKFNEDRFFEQILKVYQG